MILYSLTGNNDHFCRDSGAKSLQKPTEKTFQAAKHDASNITEQARSKPSVAEYQVIDPNPREESMGKEQEVAHIQIESQKFEDLLKLQDTVTRRRIFLDNDRRRNTAEQQSVLDALGSFMDNADSLVTSSLDIGDSSGKGVQLQRSWSRVQEVTDHFKSQSLALQKDEYELSLLETRLRRKEKEVYEGSSRTLGQFSPSNEDEDQLRKVDDSSSSEARSKEDDPLVSQYYSCLGKFNDLRDSLVNSEANYRRRAFQRERKRAKGELLDLSDSAFEGKHLRKRNARLAELVATRKQVDHLMDQCSEQGLHVEKHQLPALGDDSLLNQFERFPQIIFDNISSNNMAGGDVDNAAVLVSGSLDKESQIATWLGQVDLEPPWADGHDTSLGERPPITPLIHRP